MRSGSLVFAYLCTLLAKELGLPVLIGQVIQGVLLLLLLLVLVGVL
jgi:hypothetical protein